MGLSTFGDISVLQRQFEDIKAEIDKCVPLCVRCHAEITQKERE